MKIKVARALAATDAGPRASRGQEGVRKGAGKARCGVGIASGAGRARGRARRHGTKPSRTTPARVQVVLARALAETDAGPGTSRGQEGFGKEVRDGLAPSGKGAEERGKLEGHGAGERRLKQHSNGVFLQGKSPQGVSKSAVSRRHREGTVVPSAMTSRRAVDSSINEVNRLNNSGEGGGRSGESPSPFFVGSTLVAGEVGKMEAEGISSDY